MDKTPIQMDLEHRMLLTDIAMGRHPADLYIRNCKLVNVMSGEIIEQTCIGVAGGNIAWVGDDLLVPGPDTQVIDAQGSYVLPGLLEAHVHLESSMMTFREFARIATRWGTTSVFPDPHEIANVCGVAGIKALIDESKLYPLRSFMLMPSCVPSLPGHETPGAEIDAHEFARQIVDSDIFGLGEMMNYPGVAANDPEVLHKIQSTIDAKKTLTGHLTTEDPRFCNAYVAAGITSCHESVTAQQAVEKLRMGLAVMIREGSGWKDLKKCIQPFVNSSLDTSNVMLVSDDIHADTLLREGHVNRLVNMAIAEGVEPVKAIQMATINPARYYGLDHRLGSIAPGRLADMIICQDIRHIEPSLVLIGGIPVYDQTQPSKKTGFDRPGFDWPAGLLKTIHIPNTPKPEDLLIRTSRPDGTSVWPVIQVLENSAMTERIDLDVTVRDGQVCVDLERDLLLAVCLERHQGTGRLATTLVRGFGLKHGAIAQTVAHDCHNVVAVGTDPNDIVAAIEALQAMDGGLVVVDAGKALASLSLPIGGLMTTAPIAEIADALQLIEKAYQQLGCRLQSPYMTLAMLALPVIPHLRLTDRGLFDVDQFQFFTE